MTRFLKLVVFIAAVLATSDALFIHIPHSDLEGRCFFEEIPHETLIMVNFKLSTWDPMKDGEIRSINNTLPDNTGLGLKVSIKDPNGAIILSKTYKNEGRFVFTSHMAGDHTICLSSNDSSLQGYLRVHLNIKVGGNAVDYDLVNKKEKLTTLQLQLRKVQDTTDQIRKEQDYQRTREKRFRLTSESTNSRVLWFAVIQTVTLLTIGVYQVCHLKMFFIMKKLV